MSNVQGVFSYELKDLISAYFAYRKTKPYYGLLKLSTIVLVIVIVLTLLSFVPIFLISFVAQVSTKSYMLELTNTTWGAFTLALLLLLLLPGIGLQEPLTRSRIKREFEKNKSTYTSKYKLVVDKDGLSVNIPDWSSTLGWSRVEKVYEYKDGFLIIYNHGGKYLPIPKKAFKQVMDIQEFRELVNQQIEKGIAQV